MVLISFILDYSIKNYSSMDSRLKLLIEAGIMNECGDEYSAVPFDVLELTGNFEEAESQQKQVTVLAIVSLVVLLLPIFMVCGCVCCWSVVNKSKANSHQGAEAINQEDLSRDSVINASPDRRA